MKKLKRAILIVLALSLVATSFVGCGANGQPAGEGSEKDQKLKAEINDNGKVFQVLFAGLTREEKEHPVNLAMDRFETEVGKKIEFISCGYNEWNEKVTASIAAGTPIDCVNAGVSQYPLFAMSSMSQPIKEFVDLKSPNYDIPIMEKLLSYQGEIYSASPKDCSKPFVVFYNKDMFENQGVTTPIEYYEQGNWNYKTFKETAIKFTADTNNDGSIDRWGVACWYPFAFFGGSGASVCKISDDGKYELNIDNNQPLVEALELIQSGWGKDKWVGVDGDDIENSFFRQKNAMLCEFSWSDKRIAKAKNEGLVAFDYGVAPFPYGATNTDQVNRCFSDGFSILDGADTPYSAGKFIDIVMDEYVKVNNAEMATLPAGHGDLYKKLLQKPFNNSYFDSAVDDGKELCELVGTKNTDITQAIEKLKPYYQTLLTSANKKAEKKAAAKASASTEASK